jgi:murein DD-endopeptidase MepM/ murein hydrolase activator NlpD
MQQAGRAATGFAWAAVVGLGCTPSDGKTPPEPPVALEFAPPAPVQGPDPLTVDTATRAVFRRNDSLSTVLARVDVGPLQVDRIVRALDGLVDFTKMRAGQAVEVLQDPDGAIEWFRYDGGIEDRYVAVADGGGSLFGYREHVPVEIHTERVEGELEVSLYLAMEAIGEKPWLTLTMADIFAWDIDFFTEPRVGDRFELVVEKRTVRGELIGYGRVLAAEYAQVEGKTFQAFRYEFEDGRVGYYRADGTAVEKQFLKSPVKFASITSRYGLRRHPILKYARAHKGVDYGAPRGTAIWAVGAGVITHAGRRGGYGRLVEIRHRNGLSTRYAHLSRYGPGIRKGRRVQAKQVIGYVGSSGLATGPHLHFEVLRRGRHTNPLTVVVPPAPPIPRAELPRFQAFVAPAVAQLAGVPYEPLAQSSTATAAVPGE